MWNKSRLALKQEDRWLLVTLLRPSLGVGYYWGPWKLGRSSVKKDQPDDSYTIGSLIPHNGEGYEGKSWYYLPAFSQLQFREFVTWTPTRGGPETKEESVTLTLSGAKWSDVGIRPAKAAVGYVVKGNLMFKPGLPIEWRMYTNWESDNDQDPW